MKDFTFDIKDFSGNFVCEDIHIGKINSSCNKFSYHFKPGVYALTGDINDGGWAFSYFLTGEGKSQKVKSQAKIFVNETEIDFKHFSNKYVQNLGISRHYKKYDKFHCNTIQSLVNHNLKETNSEIKAKNICDLFSISPDRFDQNIECAGFELPLCKAAIGFSAQKKVYVFPYTTKKMYPSTVLLKRVCDVLRENGCIVLIPIYECNWIQGVYDTEINIQKFFLEQAMND